jgi:branched-chain amino acid transport system substrate-binding protein
MQKVVKWLTEVIQAKNLAIVYVNNAFGKGGRDALVDLLSKKGVNIVADVATDPGQSDFTGELARVKTSGADTLFVYLHEEESGRILPQIRDLAVDKVMKIVGHVTLLGSDVIRLAGDAANGVEGHVGLTPVANELKPVAERCEKRFGEGPDHNFYKAYINVYAVKAAVEAIGAFDQQKLRDFLHNRTLYVKDHPGILMDLYFDENGDIDRQSFLVVIKDQKPVIKDILEPLHPERFK